MSVEEKITAALAGFGLDVSNGVSFEGLAPYFTFNCATVPADFGDDAPGHELYLVQVHLFAPLNVNITALKRQVKRALYAAGFTWPSLTDATGSLSRRDRPEERHIVFECEISAEGAEDGES